MQRIPGTSKGTRDSFREQMPLNTQETQFSFFSFFLTAVRMESSRSCFSSTGDGAFDMTSRALCVFGKAMTSRIDGRFAMSMTRRSRPNARPPCGGVPYWKASIMKPNFVCACSGVRPRDSKTFSCRSAL